MRHSPVLSATYPSVDSVSSKTVSPAPSPPAESSAIMVSAPGTSHGPADRRHDIKHRSLSPYASLGQLSYAPATQTTVVTTTTTTTTSFPPILLQPPRHLNERDPKQYPLAASPTPNSIRHLRFDIGGRPACFSEADEPEQALQESQEQYTQLQAGHGTIHTITNTGLQYDETPSRPSRHHQTPSLSQAIGPRPPTAPHRDHQSSPPPSIAEAAELASLQRHKMKQRATGSSRRDENLRLSDLQRPSYRTADIYDNAIPATPDTDAGGSGQFKIPKGRLGSRTNRRLMEGLSHSRGESSRSGSLRHMQSSSLLEQVEREDSPLAETPSQGNGSRGVSGSRLPGLFSTQSAGVSATPPIAESDLEPVTACVSNEEMPELRRPTPLDTLAAQDASLPSPSLSPITAAANLAQHADSFDAENEEDDGNDVSSLDISQDRLSTRLSRKRRRGQEEPEDGSPEMPTPVEGGSPNPQLPTPTLMDTPMMLDWFDAMPDEMKTYVMFKLLQRCAKPTLHFIADVVNPALKCDFFAMLPLEMSLNIVKYLDAKSLCRAAQVSKRWRQVVNMDEKAWKSLIEAEGYTLQEGEIEKAVQQGWGWQFPSAKNDWEKDLSVAVVHKSDAETSSPISSTSSHSGLIDPEALSSAPSSSSRPKRKAALMAFTSNKKQKSSKVKRSIRGSKRQKQEEESPAWMQELEKASGPNNYAAAAILAVPEPDIGLPALRQMHLFKSLYQRHHIIRKSWMEEDAQPQHIAFRAHQRHVVTCLQFDTDKILTGSDDTNINVYDTKTGALRTTLTGHDGGVWALQYEGNTLVSGSTDRSVRVWDIAKGKCTHVFQGHTSTVRCLVILKPSKIGEHANGEPIMMPEEPLIITGSRDSSLRVWKLPKPTDKALHQAGPSANDDANPFFVRALVGHHHSVRAIAAHGDTLVSGSYDCTVRVWKVSNGDLQHRLQGHTQKVYSVVLDHQRNRCISGSMDNLVKVWSLESGANLYNLEGHTSLVGLLDLSHERLVSAAADSTLRIWDPETGQCKSTLSAHTGAITCFQHDGQKVVSGSDRTLKMWDVKTGACVKDLLSDLSGVWQVRFDERRCVAAVQRDELTYIEVLDFGAARDGIPTEDRGRRILVDADGSEMTELEDVLSRLDPAEAEEFRQLWFNCHERLIQKEIMKRYLQYRGSFGLGLPSTNIKVGSYGDLVAGGSATERGFSTSRRTSDISG